MPASGSSASSRSARARPGASCAIRFPPTRTRLRCRRCPACHRVRHTAPMEADDEDRDWVTEAFAELRGNLDYARDLIRGGQHLERLQVGAFDVADLYRSAWVQAVSSLDHWVHREVYDRALGFALDPGAQRPRRFLRLAVPM